MIKDIIKATKLTTSEKQIVEYIKQHPDCILKNTAKELSQLCFVSSPTIIRFVKKIGFHGYHDFQLNYTKEYTLEKRSPSFIFDEKNIIENTIDILPNIYEHIYLETKQMIHKETFVRIINYMLQAKQIDFYANDNNFSEIQSVCLKLNTLGIRAQAFNTLNQTYIEKANPKEVLSFVISHTGKNAAMVDVAYTLRKKKFRVIAITGKIDPTLEIICNESLYVSTLEEFHDIMPYSISIHYLLDILVLILTKKIRKTL